MHDLRAVNDGVQEIEAVVPNPYQLLNNIGDKHEYFSTIDLTSAFFTILLSEQSRHLFAFTWKGEKLSYSRLPQGFIHIFNQILKNEIQLQADPRAVCIKYVDDILVGH